MNKKQTEVFQDQIAFLVKRERYTLNDFYEGLRYVFLQAVSTRDALSLYTCARARMPEDICEESASCLTKHSAIGACWPSREGIAKAGMDGWRKHMPGVKSDPGMAK